MMIISSISRLVEKNIHWVKKRCIVSFCSITAITRCELHLAAKLRNQTIIAEVGLAKRRGLKNIDIKNIDWQHHLHCADATDDCDADQGGSEVELELKKQVTIRECYCLVPMAELLFCKFFDGFG